MDEQFAEVSAEGCIGGYACARVRRRGTTPRGHARSRRRSRPRRARRSRSSSSNSSRRWVRIISGPSVAIVNATPFSTNVRNVSRTSSSSAERLRQQVRRRADLERDVGRADRRHQLRVARREDAVAEPVRAKRLDHLADLLDAVLAALLADVDRHAEPAVARQLDVLADLRVVVPRRLPAEARRCRRRRSRAARSAAPSRRSPCSGRR